MSLVNPMPVQSAPPVAPLSDAGDGPAPTEHVMQSWDGATIFYRAWLPGRPTTCALLLFHRGHEHSGRWNQTVQMLGLEGVAVFAWDQRGHGRSPGERGSAAGLEVIVRDADAFARHVCRTHGVSLADTAVLAHSVGAVIAAAWAHDYAPPLRAMVLATPALRVKLYVPFAVPMLRLKRALLGGGGGIVKSYVKANVLTHDPAQQAEYRADPLIFRQIAVNILLDLHETAGRLMADAGAIEIPTLILSAGKDWVVKLAAQKRFFRELAAPVKRLDFLPGFYHAVFHERDCRQVTQKVRAFLMDAFTRAPQGREHLVQADRGGYTSTEYDLLRTPGGMRWRAARVFLKSVGRLSDGIRLGWRTGFDSGLTLDYVYRNRPAGLTPIGRLIDWFYLNSAGWRGIRIRRQNLQGLLRQCMIATHRAGNAVHILDVAAGAGRYVAEALHALPEVPATATLCDNDPANLEAARRLCQALGVAGVTIARVDAFDRASLAAMAPRPAIAIVSGLYELVPDNDRVLRSLLGIADALADDGTLLYTNQPWHPQIEFIARALTNREGRPWVMRRRTQPEMDELVRLAGFEKTGQEVDRWGIFTVSTARRLSRVRPHPGGGTG